MNKLLKFFIPKITFETFKFFCFLVAAVLLIHFMPISQQGKSFFSNILLFVGFPIITYFNRFTYLPTSIDWILLTPNKKTHIALVHGLINIFKIVLLFVLINIVFYVLEGSFLAKLLFDVVIKENGTQIFTRLPVLSLVGLLSILGLVVVFIFGILPNYVQNIQQRQNYQVKKTPKENFKQGVIICGWLLMGVILVSEDTDLEVYFPWFLRVSALFVFFVFAAILSTLTTLRYYFSKNKFYLVSGVCFVIFSFFLYSYAASDISSKNLHVRNKIESLDFLGGFSHGLDMEIEKDLLASEPGLANLTEAKLLEFFKDNLRMDIASKVLLRWDETCSNRKDFTCRLAYGMRRITKLKPNSLDMVKQSCPNDLASCFLVYSHGKYDQTVLPQELQDAFVLLTLKCKTTKDKFELTTCRDFNRSIKNEKK